MKKIMQAVMPFVFLFTALFAMSNFKHKEVLTSLESQKIVEFFKNKGATSNLPIE
ncbi:hypothetical protein KHA93_02290 [Bacillus sp. FJAT-49732]|uniref:Uncharacterized protein n=1 Tax=Lederbergia citrisecunda TaxID=2833583 RepID=A0A942TIX3_9BACI|nr:hypothetical protein [Lederbergia citrisecunda]MBS4198475.1 hypothetical protein [Lederbergia citrisecunda]